MTQSLPRSRNTRKRTALGSLAVLFGCASPPLPTVEHVDLDRFMGDWYVLAHIPAKAEAAAFNAVETYENRGDGEIATTFSFRQGAFDAPIETMTPTGFVRDESNATWGMRFFWPLTFEYLIAYLDPDYTTTIIARSRRDYAWIMTREPEVSEARFVELCRELEALGYDMKKLRRVPHRWPDPGHPRNAALHP